MLSPLVECLDFCNPFKWSLNCTCTASSEFPSLCSSVLAVNVCACVSACSHVGGTYVGVFLSNHLFNDCNICTHVRTYVHTYVYNLPAEAAILCLSPISLPCQLTDVMCTIYSYYYYTYLYYYYYFYYYAYYPGCHHEVLGTASGRAPVRTRTSSPVEREFSNEGPKCVRVYVRTYVHTYVFVETNWLLTVHPQILPPHSSLQASPY